MSAHQTDMISSQARNSILQKLHGANAQANEAEALDYQPWGHQVELTLPQKTQRFITNMTNNHTEVMHISLDELESTIEDVVVKKGLTTAATGTRGKYLKQFALGLRQLEVTSFDFCIESWKSALFENIDVGITHCLAGIADTGALVLWPSSEEPRTLSLVPPCHIAVIDESSIMSNFIEVIETQNWKEKMPTNALLISGPSKTADIQQTLAYGAHGPSELVVLIIKA